MPSAEGLERGAFNALILDTEESQKIKDVQRRDKNSVPKVREEEMKSQAFAPNFCRPLAYVHEDVRPEPIFLMPSVQPEPYWDFTIGSDVSKVKKLLQRDAEERTLSGSQKELILRTFENDPECLVHYGFHPDRLLSVIHNKEIVIDFLNKMTSFQNITQYYNVFLKIEHNIKPQGNSFLNTLEVFNALVQSTQLPKEFILSYVKCCFKCCENQPNPKSKKRLV